MTVDVEREAVSELAPGLVAEGPSLTTPAGLQAIATLNARRLTFLVLNVATWMLLVIWAGAILSAGGWTPLTVVSWCASPSVRRGLCSAFGTPRSVFGSSVT